MTIYYEEAVVSKIVDSEVGTIKVQSATCKDIDAKVFNSPNLRLPVPEVGSKGILLPKDSFWTEVLFIPIDNNDSQSEVKDKTDAFGAISTSGSDVWEMSIQDESFHVKSGVSEITINKLGKFIFKNATAEFVTIMSVFLENFLTHTHGTGVGQSSPPLPPELETLQAEKIKLDTFKE